jgi:hypothetical protein
MAIKSSPYRGFRIIGPQRQIIYAKSLWEANYAKYLQWLQDEGKISFWVYEPKIFYFEGIKRGCTNYRPDFLVHVDENTKYYVEVKGWMDPKSATKIKRFRKYFPEDEIRVVDAKWFKENAPILKNVVPFWDSENKTYITSKDQIKELT